MSDTNPNLVSEANNLALAAMEAQDADLPADAVHVLVETSATLYEEVGLSDEADAIRAIEE